MVAPRLRSTSIIRKNIKTPGGRRRLHFKKRPTGFAKCGSCGRSLLGVPRKGKRKLSRSEKVPNRPFGGNLCSICTRRLFKAKARG